MCFALGKQYVYLEQRWNTRISPNRVTDSVSIHHFDWSGLICGVVGLLCTLRESISSHFFRLHWPIWKYSLFLLARFLDWFGLIRHWGHQSFQIAKLMQSSPVIMIMQRFILNHFMFLIFNEGFNVPKCLRTWEYTLI